MGLKKPAADDLGNEDGKCRETGAFPEQEVEENEVEEVCKETFDLIVSLNASKSTCTPTSTKSKGRISRSMNNPIDESKVLLAINPSANMPSSHSRFKGKAKFEGKSVVRKLFADPTKMPNVCDRMDVIRDESDIIFFKEWYNVGKAKKSKQVETPLPVYVKTSATQHWFASIFERNMELRDDHIDVILNLIIYKYKKDPNLYLNDWTLVEWLGMGHLINSENFASSYSSLYNYVSGEYLKQGAMAWKIASRCLGIAHVNGNHWVTFEVSFDNQIITVYDSLFKTQKWGAMKENFATMAKFLPWICRHEGIWKEKGFTMELREVWDIECGVGAPIQANATDCGIMALKFVECLVLGLEVTIVEPELCALYRRSYGAQLYDLGISGVMC